MGGWGVRIVGEFGMDLDTLLCLKWIAKRDLLCGTGISAQCNVAAVFLPGGSPWTEEPGRAGKSQAGLSDYAQPGWEGTLRENGCMYMYSCAPSLFS